MKQTHSGLDRSLQGFSIGAAPQTWRSTRVQGIDWLTDGRVVSIWTKWWRKKNTAASLQFPCDPLKSHCCCCSLSMNPKRSFWNLFKIVDNQSSCGPSFHPLIGSIRRSPCENLKLLFVHDNKERAGLCMMMMFLFVIRSIFNDWARYSLPAKSIDPMQWTICQLGSSKEKALF